MTYQAPEVLDVGRAEDVIQGAKKLTVKVEFPSGQQRQPHLISRTKTRTKCPGCNSPGRYS